MSKKYRQSCVRIPWRLGFREERMIDIDVIIAIAIGRRETHRDRHHIYSNREEIEPWIYRCYKDINREERLP